MKTSSVGQTPSKPSVQESRKGKRVISGYFDPAVAKSVKGLAVELDATVQQVMALAFNDLLEKFGKGRPADDSALRQRQESRKP